MANRMRATAITLFVGIVAAAGCNDEIADHRWVYPTLTCDDCDGDCVHGVCVPHGECSPACDADKGEMCFHSACVQISTDCNPACGSDEECINGECLPLNGCKPACKSYEVCINGACIDPWRICEDDGGNVCLGNQFCVADLNNSCVPSGNICHQTCAAGRVCFNGACVLESEDCGAACSKDQVCINGQCATPGVCSTKCSGGLACINGMCYDPQFCKPACVGQVCVAGRCVDQEPCDPECTAPEVCINGTCTDPNACVPECPPGQQCIQGVCSSVSTEGCFPACQNGELCFQGTCIKPKYDDCSCDDPKAICVNKECIIPNICAPECTGEQVCVNSVCKDTKPHCETTAQTPTSDNVPVECEEMEICISVPEEVPPDACFDPGNLCVPSCKDGKKCFNGICINPDGGCDSGQCKNTEICINGDCETPGECTEKCKDTEICLNGACTDPNYCFDCPAPGVCVLGRCILPDETCDPKCEDGKTCFQNTCIATPGTDDCNPACQPTEVCVNGKCESRKSECDPSCHADQECVGGVCIDPKRVCEAEEPPVVCLDDQYCINRPVDPEGRALQCTNPESNVCSPKCAEGKVCFNGACITPGDDCSKVCGDNAVCINKKCEEPGVCSTKCAAGLECLNGVCYDPNFCKEDGKLGCPAGKVCDHGTCKDPDNLCDPECKEDEQCIHNTCIKQDDSCNPACDPAKGEVCINGVCVTTECNPACTDKQLCVGGVCIDPKPVCTPICVGETVCAYDDCHVAPGQICTPRCNDKTQICYNNQCVPKGDCDPECDAAKGELCINGACINPSVCSPACPTGEVCVNNHCIDPNFCAPECVSPQVCIEGACVDPTLIDPDKQCNPTCKNDTVCKDGTCVPACAEGLVFYNGECFDPTVICRPECDPGLTCVDNICRIDCEDATKRCGYYDNVSLTDETLKEHCCNSDELCVFPRCVKETEDNHECTTDSDCDYDKYCDPITNKCINADDVADICSKSASAEDFTNTSLKYQWPSCLPGGKPSKFESSTNVIVTPLVAPLIDTNKDGVINEKDKPVLAFISYNRDYGHGPDTQAGSVLRVISLDDEIGKCTEIVSSEAIYSTYPLDLAIADVDDPILEKADGPELIAGTNGHCTSGRAECQLPRDGFANQNEKDRIQILKIESDGSGYKLVEKYALTITNKTKTYTPAIAYLDPANDKTPSIVTNYGAAMVDPTTKQLAWRPGCEQIADDVKIDGKTRNKNWSMPHLLDLDGDGVKEIVTAKMIYDANCKPLLADNALAEGKASFVAVADLMPDSDTAAADGELVPELAMVTSGANGGSFEFWKVYLKDGAWSVKKAKNLKIPVDSSRVTQNRNASGGGNPVIADFNGDTIPDVGLAARFYYIVYSNDGTPTGGEVLWADGKTQDYSSAVTGSSVFDFDGDGTAEVVYSDETRLRVYKGKSDAEKPASGYTKPTIIFERPNYSATGWEYPIIADVDGDGETEIVVASDSAGADYTTKIDGKDVIFSGQTRGVNVWYDPDRKWVRSRRIWNQHQYHISNIEENGNVPHETQAHWLIDGVAPNWSHAASYQKMKYNNYRQNIQPSGILNAPDFYPRELSVNDANCPMYIHFDALVLNRGTIGTSTSFVVRFYVDDSAGDKLIGIVPVDMSLPAGGHAMIKFTWIDRVVLDADGNPTSETVDLTSGADIYYVVDFSDNISECDETNNASKLYHLDAKCALTDTGKPATP